MMNEATILKKTIEYFGCRDSVLFVDPGSDGSYDDVRHTVADSPNYRLNDSVTIAGRTPDVVGLLGRNELIAVEAKGEGDLRKAIGQATDYRRGVHKSYLAAELSKLAKFSDAAQAAGLGLIPVNENGVNSDRIQAPNPQIAGTEIDSTRRAIALKTAEFESGRLVFPPMFRPENALLPVLAIKLEGEDHHLTKKKYEDTVKKADPEYSENLERPIRLARTLQLVKKDAEEELELTGYGRCSYHIVESLHRTDSDSELTLDIIDQHRDDSGLIAFLRDRYLATPPIRLLVRILADQESSRMELSRVLSVITRESPDVFTALFCKDEEEFRELINTTSEFDRDFREKLLGLTKVTNLYNFVKQLQVIGILNEASDKTDTSSDLEVGELYWDWDPDQIGAVGNI